MVEKPGDKTKTAKLKAENRWRELLFSSRSSGRTSLQKKAATHKQSAQFFQALFLNAPSFLNNTTTEGREGSLQRDFVRFVLISKICCCSSPPPQFLPSFLSTSRNYRHNIPFCGQFNFPPRLSHQPASQSIQAIQFKKRNVTISRLVLLCKCFSVCKCYHSH